MLRVGTSGYSFADWKGSVYPPELTNRNMLIYYAYQLKFNSVEINYTYYRQPSAQTLNAMLNKVPEDFDFTIKAYKEMTHQIFDENRHIKDNGDVFQVYREGIAPLLEAKRLGCVCFSFLQHSIPDRRIETIFSPAKNALRMKNLLGLTDRPGQARPEKRKKDLQQLDLFS